MKKHKNSFIDIGILIAVTIVTYFPVSTFLYSLKNDSLVQYLPFRYHLSESIQHGYFPFWNPYLYTGFPIHADMQGMTWNPIVLLISLFTRYNMSVLEFEVTIYLVLAAIGMYSLLKSFSLHRLICLLGAISYMSCGFINGSASVIPWISSAAFIPFVLLTLKLILDKPVLKNALLFSAALSLLFLCGYPTFFIYTGYLIFVILAFAVLINRDNLKSVLNWKYIGFFALSGILFLLICSPAIISYVDFLPYYSRGTGITAAKAAENPFTPYSSISFFLPNAVNKDHIWLNTDPSMRNGYVGIFVFALASLSLLFRKNKWQKLILGLSIFSFLLSLGSVTPIHKICYNILPGFNTFRHPGNIRLFTSIGIILLAALFIQKFLETVKTDIRKKLIYTLYILGGILLLPLVYSLAFQSGIVGNIVDAVRTKQPKAFIDTLRFPSMLLIQALLQLAFVGSMSMVLRKKEVNRKFIAILIAANSILFCWIALPFNFISQIKTSEVNRYVASFPDGYPKPDINESVGANIISDSTTFPVYGYPNFYSKKITIQDYIITPTLNGAYEKFNADKKLRRQLKDYPLAWLNDTIVTTVPDTINKRFSLGCFVKRDWTDSTIGSIELTEFSPNKMKFKVSSSQTTVLSLFQQYNQNWQVTLNGEKAYRLRMNTAFMGTAVPAGTSEVAFTYKPRSVIIAAWISLLTLLLLTAYFLFNLIRKRRS